MTRRALLACGIASVLVYLSYDIAAASRYPGYDPFSHLYRRVPPLDRRACRGALAPECPAAEGCRLRVGIPRPRVVLEMCELHLDVLPSMWNFARKHFVFQIDFSELIVRQRSESVVHVLMRTV